MGRVLLPLALGALLTACGPQDAPRLSYTLASDGVNVTGTGLSISFGRAEDGARSALAKLAGPEREVTVRPGCGTAVRHLDGLVVIHGDGVFVGWIAADGRSAGRACS
jgi:hypothetical protein